MPIAVGVDNFVRAETDRMFAALQADAGGINVFRHNREPTSIEGQTVIRMNRDTLYSFAIADISGGARVTVPDSGSRYLSVMVVNQDHYINRLFHDPGEYELTVAEFDTQWVLVAVRVLVDPVDPADVAVVTAIQDRIKLDAGSSTPFELPEYETSSFGATRSAVLELAKHVGELDHSFGTRDEVDPVRHLIATAAGWGGLPDREARYVSADPGDVSGACKLTVRNVPVDGFWSISVYNAAGFFEKNDRDAYSINNITATPDADGLITVHFGGCADDRPNCLPITDGWNYIVRLYRPRAEILDGSWTFPSIEPA
jgi:hypothetical protein